MNLKKAIFLDRDGVLNKAILQNGRPHPPGRLEDFEIIPEIIPVLDNFKKLGYILIGITNQPDVKRGKTSKSFVEKINQNLLEALPLEEVITCYHDNDDQCDCRKPKPGAIIEASIKYNIDLKKSYMVGDRWKDIEAGIRAGCKTIFIDYDYEEVRPIGSTYTVKSLAEIYNIFLDEE